MSSTTDSPATADVLPQWQVHFLAEVWCGDNAISVSPEGEDTWYIRPEDAESAMVGADFDDLAYNNGDRRIPAWVLNHAHQHPFTVTLTCTGCGRSATAIPSRAELGVFADHTDCAPDAPDAPPAQLDGDHQQQYTVEIRATIYALTPERAAEHGTSLADRIGGRVAAVTADESTG